MKSTGSLPLKTIFVLLCCVVILWAETARQKLAVLGIQSSSHASKSGALTEKVLDELFKMDLFLITAQSEVEEAMAAIGLAQSGCTQKMCAVEVGEIVGADRVIVGTVSGVKAKFKISLKMVDVATGEVVRKNSHTVEGSFTSVLQTGMMKATRGLIGSVYTYQDAESIRSESLAKRKTMKTVFAILSAVTSTGFGGACAYYWSEKEKFSDLAGTASTPIQKSRYEDDEKTAAVLAGVFTGLSGAFLTTSIILFVVKPEGGEKKKVSLNTLISPAMSAVSLSFSF